MRTIIVVIYVFLFLILGLPVLGIEWIIAKFDKNMYQQIRLYFILEITAAFLILSLLMHSVRI